METLLSLRSTLIKFFRQRKAGADRMPVAQEVRSSIKFTCDRLLKKFDLIRDWGYWRNCLEVQTCRREIEAILPKDTAGHKQIRAHIMEVIEHCCLMASYPKNIVDAQELERRRQSAR